MIAQSRFLARDARVAVDEGNATLGTILALAGLPSDLGNPDRPFIDDAEDALEDAFANRRESVILKGHDEAVAMARGLVAETVTARHDAPVNSFSPDQSRIGDRSAESETTSRPAADFPQPRRFRY